MTGPSPRAPRPTVVLDEPHPAAGPDVAGLGLEATAAESYWTRRQAGGDLDRTSPRAGPGLPASSLTCGQSRALLRSWESDLYGKLSQRLKVH